MAEVEHTKVWDIAVRIFHWSLVLFFIISYVTGEEEGQLHIQAGYVVLALILFRIVWGFIGSRHARFWEFVVGPRQALAYTRSLFSGVPKHYLGHNPLAGWMILALLVFILLTIWSGLELEASAGRGLLASEMQMVPTAYADDDRYKREHHSEHEDDEHEEHGLRFQSEKEHEDEEQEEAEGDEFWEELHEFFANFTLLLIAMHIVGVLVASGLHHENLVKAMITGYK